MSGWWIVPGQGLVTVDDAPISGLDCSIVDPTIYLIRWWDTSGEILFNHDARLPVRQPFTDLSPYIQLFNQWMAAAENPNMVARTNEGSPPITLAQAKQVKASMIDALFASKRQLPVTYLGYVWDGSDNATGAMSDQIAAVSGTDAINSAVGGLAASTNQALSDLANSTSAAVQSVTTQVNDVNSTYAGAMAGHAANLNTEFSDAQVGHNYNADSITAHANTLDSLNGQGGSAGSPIYVPPGQLSGAHPTTPNLGAASAGIVYPPGVSAPTVSATPATGPPIAWPPLNGPPVTLTYVQFTTLLSMLTSRRGSLQLTRTTHKNNVAGLTTVPDIVAYDITSGW